MHIRLLLTFIITIITFNNLHAQGRLEGKVAIITGASKGIGKGIAKTYAEEGAKVVLLSRTEKDLQQVVQEIKEAGGEASYIIGDVGKAEDMRRMAAETLKRHGRIDILVHNAAIYPINPIEEMTEAQWHKVINVNLNSTFYAVKAVLPTMKKQKYGRIVFTSSISGPRTGLPTMSHYTASKAGVNGFMRTVALELAKDNITVNAVEPGIVMTEGVVESGQAYIDAQKKSVPMGRLGTPEEIAKVHLFLASDDSSFITGQSIIIDGGQILAETMESFN